MPRAASTTIAGAIAALRSDLELTEQRAVEIKGLIGKLEAYTNGTGGILKRGKGRRRGRKPLDPDDTERARKAANTRAWRSRQAKVETPKAKPRKRQRRRKAADAAAVDHLSPIAADVPSPVAVVEEMIMPPVEKTEPVPAAVEVAPAKRKRRSHNWTVEKGAWRQPPTEVSEFVPDENGVLSRVLRTSGETPVL
jgi:hypothetical protein